MQNISGLSTTGINAPKFDGSQACTQVDPELFFPEDSAQSRRNMVTIKTLCEPCQFKAPCLTYAVKHPELLGIWAATTEKDRRFIRYRKRAVAALIPKA
jgi:Transcription factor WhiB